MALKAMDAEHEIFSHFNPFSGFVPAGHGFDYLGALSKAEWGAWTVAQSGHYTAPVHRDDEYFEFVDLLTAAKEARGRFVMIELGAGFGRWGVRGALAARKCGLTEIDIRFVEAEPQHAAWIKDAIALNGLDPHRCRVIEVALDYAGEEIPFLVSAPALSAENWYGQAVWQEEAQPTDRAYFGRPVLVTPTGYEIIRVPTATFEEVSEGLDRIDLVDVDVQGAELDLIKNELQLLSRKVKRIHIGTHSAEADNLIQRAFSGAGWQNVWSFPWRQESDTPYGRYAFDDGVQSWVNPSL